MEKNKKDFCTEIISVGHIYDLSDEKDQAKWNRQFNRYNKLRDRGGE